MKQSEKAQQLKDLITKETDKYLSHWTPEEIKERLLTTLNSEVSSVMTNALGFDSDRWSGRLTLRSSSPLYVKAMKIVNDIADKYEFKEPEFTDKEKARFQSAYDRAYKNTLIDLAEERARGDAQKFFDSISSTIDYSEVKKSSQDNTDI